ncbi:uncharacterized protein LOC141641532 [Silene latifolia]|uniref:uncharacterized protein LOC141641532 n=1 Tax=Silene latifolia TaxID=37657 RepID=UPI003D781789
MGIHMIHKGDAIGDLTIELELYDDIKRKQEVDPKIQEWKSRVESGTVSRLFINTDGSVHFDGRWCVSNDDLKKLIMTEAHCTPYSVHPGSDKLYKDLKKTFWWPGMKKDVAEFVARCLTYQRIKGEQRRPQDKIQSLEVPERKWESISMDFIVGKYRSPVYWDDSAEAVILGLQMVQDMIDQVKNIELDEALTYEEVPKEILDRKVRKTRNGETVLLKVLWSNHNMEEATWEPEEAMRERYPHLFITVVF